MEQIHVFFISNAFFSTQPPCCFTQPRCYLTFSWIGLQIFLRCCLMHITITLPRHIFYLVYLCPFLDLQSFSKYFETFWCSTKFSFHHKWNDARLLINMAYTRCLTTCRTTWYLASYEIKKNDSLVPILPAKIKILLILTKNSWKSVFFRSALFDMKTRVSLKHSVSDCRSIYVISMSSIFHFQSHFHWH